MELDAVSHQFKPDITNFIALVVWTEMLFPCRSCLIKLQLAIFYKKTKRRGC